MSFSFEINETGNASMTDDEGRPCAERRRAEFARLLKETAAKVEAGQGGGDLFDANGNRVGWWGDDEDEESPEDDEEEARRRGDLTFLSGAS